MTIQIAVPHLIISNDQELYRDRNICQNKTQTDFLNISRSPAIRTKSFFRHTVEYSSAYCWVLLYSERKMFLKEASADFVFHTRGFFNWFVSD